VKLAAQHHQVTAVAARPSVSAPVSVVIITKDERQHIQRCLESVQWASEMVVIDAGSTDGTPELAEQLGARVISRDWPGYAPQKNYGIDQAAQPWILSLDADEEVTPELATDIERVVESADAASGYRLRRVTYFLGRPLHHYGRARRDPGQVRLVAQGHGRFEDRLVHERLEVVGSIGSLHAPLLHHCYPTLQTYWQKIHRYAGLEAQDRAARGGPKGGPELRALGKLGWMLVFRRGLLHGPRAWLWIAGQSYQEWLTTRQTRSLGETGNG
jgi:glycosyltransferase involved in cell wall biosynthesis